MKKFIVHKVQPNKDTLFKLSYNYKVSKREIQLVNGFSGEDIFFMTEMLIPYKGQTWKPHEPTQEDKDREEMSRRAACLHMLEGAIQDSEEKHMKKGLIPRIKPPKNYNAEAKFYFEENNFEYWASIKNYKEDLEVEVEHHAKEKEKMRIEKLNKRKRRFSKKVGADEDFGEDRPRCIGTQDCSIF